MSYCEDCVFKKDPAFRCKTIIGEYREIALLGFNGEPALAQTRIYGQCKTTITENEENLRLLEAMK